MVVCQYFAVPSRKRQQHTESGEVRQFGRVIRHRTHDPVGRSLPHRIKYAAENV